MRTAFGKWVCGIAVGTIVGIASAAMSPEPAVAAPLAPCGLSSGCYYVPDGCGVGVGCAHVTCLVAACPDGDPNFTHCWYCDESEPCEECSPALPEDESAW